MTFSPQVNMFFKIKHFLPKITFIRMSNSVRILFVWGGPLPLLVGNIGSGRMVQVIASEGALIAITPYDYPAAAAATF